jgi:hypothetical protein
MFEIGMVVYVYDENYRIYKDNRIVEKEHFRPHVITDQTSRSWIVNGRKYSKTDPNVNLFTEQTRDDWLWEKENRYKIADKVRFCTLEQLRAIDSILNQT